MPQLIRLPRIRAIRGFNLVELAVVLAVVGLLLAGILVPLTTQIAQRNVQTTEKALEDIKDALLGYAAATGRLPCPATDSSFGLESFASGGDQTNGSCASFLGFVPAVTLGISRVDGQGFAIDAWGLAQNRIRYAVSNETLNGVTNPFTTSGGMRRATMQWVANAALLHVCSSAAPVTGSPPICGVNNTLTDNAPVVIWSVGANAATGGSSADEIQNPNPNQPTASADRIFVSHVQTAAPEFDDIVTWLSGGVLVNRMIVSGQLP